MAERFDTKFDKKETESFNYYVEKGEKPVKEVMIEKKDKSFLIKIMANQKLLDLFQQKR